MLLSLLVSNSLFTNPPSFANAAAVCLARYTINLWPLIRPETGARTKLPLANRAVVVRIAHVLVSGVDSARF